MKVTLTWVGGEHDFALPIGGLRAVQDACNAGPMEILTSFRLGNWRVDYPLSVIRHGLIGGGMAEKDARTLVNRMAEHHPLGAFLATAQLVLAAAIVGVPDDPVGDEEPGETAGGAPESSASAKSTE